MPEKIKLTIECRLDNFYKIVKQKLKENDLLMVTKIDRCSRDTLEFLKLLISLWLQHYQLW